MHRAFGASENMKYSNALKYMSAFPVTADGVEPSPPRVRRLCERLGRINLGARYICLPGGSAGHASAMMLEEIMVAAGHAVGRICLDETDPRAAAYICGRIASIEDFSTATSELRSAAQREVDESYLFCEAMLVLGLLLCRMSGCEYIILEGVGGNSAALEAVCAPYELIIIPTLYGEHEEMLRHLGECIRRGTREVVSGNQKSEVYNRISNACAVSGVRLCIPVKAQFEVVELTGRSLGFNYCGREGFSMRSPSRLLRDAAMTVIESALALRRGGIKLPWSSIISGIAAEGETGCFELLSLSPLILTDTAESLGEAELLVATAEEVWGDDALSGAAICLEASAAEALGAFENKEIGKILVCGGDDGYGRALGVPCAVCPTVKATAKELANVYRKGGSAVCLGSVAFVSELKSEFQKIM